MSLSTNTITKTTINTGCKNIRFIASAGTGKTHQVVSLYQALLLGRPYPPDDTSLPGAAAGSIFDGRQRVAPDRILMLTFTRNAAAEMRSRVTEAIEKELATGDPDNEAFCWSLLRRLSGATISTIHAFAQLLLSRHTLELGLSPTLAVLEEADAAILRTDAVKTTLCRALTQGQPTLIQDLEKLCEGHGVNQIEQAVLQTISQCATWGLDLENADPASLVLAPTEPRLHDLQTLLSPIQLKAGAVTGNSIKTMAAEMQAAIRQLGLAPAPAAVADAARKLLPFTKTVWGRTDDVKELRENVKTTLLELAAYADRQEATRLFISFLTLARESARGIRARKTEQGVLDFDDLLSRARDLIQRNPGAVPATDVIIVDEAQDNSRLQNELILLIQAASKAAVAACGDTKQTIYSWRGADPEGLNTLGKTLKLAPIPLRTSYRSQQGILDWVNDIFAGVVMGTELYGETEVLLPCPAAKASTGPAVECLLPDWEILPDPRDQITIPGKTATTCARLTLKKSDIKKLADPQGREASPLAANATTQWPQVAELTETALALEARAVARRIRLLTTPTATGNWHPPRVWDSATNTWITPQGRPYRFRDILILLRATQRQDLYEQALQEENIPFTTDGAGRGFFLRQEVQDVANLLSWLAFPLDRQTLLALLRSPFCALSDNAVAMLAADPSDPSLRSLVTAKEVDAHRIAAKLAASSTTGDAAVFLRTATLLRRLCGLAGRISAVELVREAVRLTGYDAILAGTFHGVQRLANLQKLLSWIQDLERSENLDLQSTATRLATEISNGREAPDAAVLDPDDDSVRINTVHAAKGLSSPVVIVPDLRRTPRNDTRWIHVIRDESAQHATLTARLKFYQADDTLQEKVDTEGYAGEVARNKVARNEESRRLFYVAATRARDLLIFSAENPNINSDETWRTWINQHLFASDFNANLVRLRPYREIESAWRTLATAQPPSPLVTPLQLTQALCPPAQTEAREHYRFPVTALVRPLAPGMLASITVSPKSMENRESPDDRAALIDTDDAPSFNKAQLGTLAHQILETLDYHSPLTLPQQIAAALELEVLTVADRATLLSSVTSAAAAIASQLKAVSPENVIREMPFVARFTHDTAQVIVDGKVDLLYFKDETWHILDYKFSSHTAEELTARYAFQLAVYREALSTLGPDGIRRKPRFETEHIAPAAFTLTLLGISPAGHCTEVDVTDQHQPDLAARLINAARALSGNSG